MTSTLQTNDALAGNRELVALLVWKFAPAICRAGGMSYLHEDISQDVIVYMIANEDYISGCIEQAFGSPTDEELEKYLTVVVRNALKTHAQAYHGAEYIHNNNWIYSKQWLLANLHYLQAGLHESIETDGSTHESLITGFSNNLDAVADYQLALKTLNECTKFDLDIKNAASHEDRVLTSAELGKFYRAVQKLAEAMNGNRSTYTKRTIPLQEEV